MCGLVRRLRANCDQRFSDRSEEAAFVRSRARSGLNFVTCVSWTVIAVSLPYDASYLRDEMRQEVDPLVFPEMDVRLVMSLLTFVCAGTCLMAIVVAQLKLRQIAFDDVSGECLVMGVFVVIFIRLAGGRKYNITFFAQDREAAWVRRAAVSDTNVLLGIDAAITALALCAALRIHRFLCVAGTAFGLWLAANIICGSPSEGQVGQLSVLLFVLIACACAGVARIEAFIRKEWRQEASLTHAEQELCLQSALASSMQRIAERLCDLVFFLGPDLCVHSNAVPVNSFFERGMFGEPILDVIDAADRAAVQDAFLRASESQVPQCVPVTLAAGACRGQAAQLLIAGTGAAVPRFLVGMSVDHLEPAREVSAASLRGDVADIAQVAAASCAESDCQTTASGVAFSSANLEDVVALGRAERWCIDAKDLRVPVPHCTLGEGGFGIVATACYLGQTVAVKVTKGGGPRLQAALMELRVLRRFRHPSVVLLHGAVLDPVRQDVALVYELIPGLHLHELIETRSDLTAFDRFQILYATSSALCCLHLHSPSIMHGDLKPQNIKVEETQSGFRPKLLDFGLSNFHGRSKAASGGTLAWQAPETLLPHASAGTPSDVFSLGWLALLIIAGEYPHGGCDLRTLRSIVQSMMERRETPAVVLPASAPFRDHCQALCNACLQFDPAGRASAPDVQVALAGWVAEDTFCQLGVGAATRALRQVSWLRGMEALGESEAAQHPPEARVHFNADDGFRVLRADCPPGLDGSVPLPVVGDIFCDCLEDPVGFRILVLATLADLKSGALAAPLERRVGLARWRPRIGPPRQLAIRILFPSASGLVKLRIRFAALPAEGEEDVRRLQL